MATKKELRAQRRLERKLRKKGYQFPIEDKIDREQWEDIYLGHNDMERRNDADEEIVQKISDEDLSQWMKDNYLIKRKLIVPKEN